MSINSSIFLGVSDGVDNRYNDRAGRPYENIRDVRSDMVGVQRGPEPSGHLRGHPSHVQLPRAEDLHEDVQVEEGTAHHDVRERGRNRQEDIGEEREHVQVDELAAAHLGSRTRRCVNYEMLTVLFIWYCYQVIRPKLRDPFPAASAKSRGHAHHRRIPPTGWRGVTSSAIDWLPLVTSSAAT